MPRGGRRDNAGRKKNPVEKKSRGFRLTEKEYIIVREFVDKLRAEAKKEK